MLDVAPLAASDDAEVDAFFEACPTSVAQQTTAWRDVIMGIQGDEPRFLGCRAAGRLVGVLPAYRFEGPLGAILTSVPQAGPLGGVACASDVDPEPVYAALLDGYVGLGRETGCALATLITNPFWPDRARVARHLAPDYVLENECLVLDLARALDDAGEIVGGSTHLRRNVRKAQSGALSIDEEQTRTNVNVWYRIHAARHRAIGAEPLPEAMFTRALEYMVPRDKARFFFVRLTDDGRMVAGGFYLYHGTVIDALMPAIDAAYARLAPNYLLALHSMRWARARGLRHYNWQGSPPGGGVERFKRQWGSTPAAYAYVTRVTGDAGPLVRSTVEVVRAAYRWHYVLPYDRIGGDRAGAVGPSTRAGAWSRLEAAKR